MSDSQSRKERERQRRTEEILEAAEKVFTEKGFHRTTVEDVAVQAEYSVGTLYNFFPSKELLYQSMIEHRFQRLSDQMNALLAEAADPMDFLRRYIQGKIDLCYQHELFVKLYTQERMGDRFADSQLWKDKIEDLYVQFRRLLADNFRRGAAEGRFRRDITPEDMVSALEGLTDGFMYDWLADPNAFEYADKFEVMFELLVHGVGKPS
ncbi:MAG: TetR/AcrR family transcriptional regulator [Sedimentisphaerales bacterium]|nr:TetR/AcrR family transcriptional regulator [Sedimentisphaerales bacterium]